MKLQTSLALSVWSLMWVGAKSGPSACNGLQGAACTAVAGCTLDTKDKCVEVVHSIVHETCGDRSPSECEADDKCIKVKSECKEVNTGVGVKESPCEVTSIVDSDNTTIYTEIENKGCSVGFMCSVDNSTLATEGELIHGVCLPTECLGKKVPGNCNGNIARTTDTKDQCAANTERVTICHRTCSRKNPWVRITIDEDAWNGDGCGHMLEHDVEDDCKSKFPWSEWGVNRRDYVLKEHGTREDTVLRENFQNEKDEKAYWRMWEPACPYVRNGHCCQWGSKTNPCCGDPPKTATPTITHKKYVGPPGSCNAEGVGSLQDDTYSAKTGSDYAYCYYTSVPPDAQECLYAVFMEDPAPLGGTLKTNVTGDFELLCPGQGKYLPGPTVQVPAGGEGPYDSTVTGVGAISGETVTSSDPAKVTEIPTNVIPKIDIKKYAGPQGKCSLADLMNMFDERYTLPTASSPWQYCYVVSIPSDATDCVTGVKIVDPAPLGGKGIDVTTGTNKLCANDKFFFDGKLVTGLSAPEGPFSATVSGTGVNSDSKVSDCDEAAVAPPPVIEIKKYAGPTGKCTHDDIMDELTVMQDDTYSPLTKVSTWQYCYVITVPETAPECLLAVTMVDPAPLGGTITPISINSGAELCPGSVTYVEGHPVQGLTVTEGPINATVTGTGVTSGVTVSDFDDAKVIPPAVDLIPVVDIKKYAGPPGKCAAASYMTLFDIIYTLPSISSSWQYCYVITAPPGSTDCLIDVMMDDPAPIGGTSGLIAVTTGNEQLCAGNSKYIPGGVVAGLAATEGPIAAIVTGMGAITKAYVTDTDEASVTPPPKPVIEIKKYAGPKGKCSAYDIDQQRMFDDLYTLTAPGESWQYCYRVTVPSSSTECLLAVTMVDPALLGGITIAITTGEDTMCPSDVKYFDGPSVDGLDAPEGPIDAVVTGTGQTSGYQVSAQDSASVRPFGGPCAQANLPNPVCPADVELMSKNKTKIPFNPIRVISQDSKTVTFSIFNPFADDVDTLYYQYSTNVTGTSKCDSVSPFAFCQDPVTVTAHCMKGLAHNLTIVDVWFVDPNVVNKSDHDVVPPCCQPDKTQAEVPSVVYSFKVYCDSKCPTVGRRGLRDSTNGLSSLPKPEGKHDNNAELCSLEQFACGDNGNSVNVCHYSAKDGYQTYCVPQADSDVVAYFPKDYCGPCVGGYANAKASS